MNKVKEVNRYIIDHFKIYILKINPIINRSRAIIERKVALAVVNVKQWPLWSCFICGVFIVIVGGFTEWIIDSNLEKNGKLINACISRFPSMFTSIGSALIGVPVLYGAYHKAEKYRYIKSNLLVYDYVYDLINAELDKIIEKLVMLTIPPYHRVCNKYDLEWLRKIPNHEAKYCISLHKFTGADTLVTANFSENNLLKILSSDFLLNHLGDNKIRLIVNIVSCLKEIEKIATVEDFWKSEGCDISNYKFYYLHYAINESSRKLSIEVINPCQKNIVHYKISERSQDNLLKIYTIAERYLDDLLILYKQIVNDILMLRSSCLSTKNGTKENGNGEKS